MSIRKHVERLEQMDLDGPRPGVRTFTPRWRTSPLTAERMERLLPAAQIPDGPLDPIAAFGREAPLVLEIGSGHGAAAVAFASAHPEVDLLAVEVHVPGVARMLAAGEAAGLTNIRVHRGDAIPLLQDVIAPKSLAAVHLFFPDPWPKKKHAKRRFVQPHTLRLFARALAPGGVVRIATDHAVYAEHVREQVSAAPEWSLTEGDRPSWRPTDGFEAKGLAAGRAATDFTLTPPAPTSAN